MDLTSMPLSTWSIAALVLTGVAVLGSCLAAGRAGQPVLLRSAHAGMALTMAAMLLPLGGDAMRISLVALASLALLVAGHVTRHGARCPTALPCLLDLIGMALALAAIELSGDHQVRPAVAVLVAAGWAVLSTWVRWEQWLRRAAERLVTAEALTAVVAAGAMALMAVAMPPG